MIGNLKVFLGMNEFGEYEIDLYGEALRNLGGTSSRRSRSCGCSASASSLPS